jgi:hypothetical protein
VKQATSAPACFVASAGPTYKCSKITEGPTYKTCNMAYKICNMIYKTCNMIYTPHKTRHIIRSEHTYPTTRYLFLAKTPYFFFIFKNNFLTFSPLNSSFSSLRS